MSIIKEWIQKWYSLKPIQRKFWTWFIIIKAAVFLIVLILFIIFVMKFKQNLWK